MDEYVMRQKIQNAYLEPQAPEELIKAVSFRTQAVAMGLQAQKQLETAPAEQVGDLAARALIGQLATVLGLSADTQLEKLVRQLQQEPAFAAALRGGNIVRRVNSGELLRQIAGLESVVEQATPEELEKRSGGLSL